VAEPERDDARTVGRAGSALETPQGMRLVFDRGTLLLLDPPPGLDLDGVAGVRWDQRVSAHRAPAARYLELCLELGRRGVRFSDSVRNPVTPSGVVAGGPPPPGLRPYQEGALSAWQLAGQRGIVVLPTGAGKTRVALAAIHAVRARSGARCLCLVPTRVLLHQWAAELSRSLGPPVSIHGDGAHEVSAVTVATFESAYRYMPVLGDRFELLVVDEVHHFGSGLRDEALQMSIAPWRLGLTATPPAAAALEGLQMLVGPIVYELGVADLAGRFLADFEVIRWTLDLDEAERTVHDDAMARFRRVHTAFALERPGASWAEFAAAAGRTQDGRAALTALREAARVAGFTRAKRAALRVLLGRHRDGRVLVFTSDTPSAYEIARAELVMPLTAEIGRAERDRAVAAFRRGSLRVLVACRVLNEGFDVPEAEVAIITGGRLGEREHVQRVGRLLRPAPGKRALIYELVSRDTVEVRQAERRRRALGLRG
jgi:superfamily II DNA or RNA helicase